jgi:hypothetical protein
VKTPTELEATRLGADSAQELQPWADPFIARLVAKYRLRAALDDSLHYLTHESAIPRSRLPRTDLPQTDLPHASLPHGFPQIGGPVPAGILPHDARRFTFPTEGEQES